MKALIQKLNINNFKRLQNFQLSNLANYVNEFLFAALAVFLIIPVKKVFVSETSFITGQYSDFASISLFASELIVVALFFLKYSNFKQLKRFIPIIIVFCSLLVTQLVFGLINNQLAYLQGITIVLVCFSSFYLGFLAKPLERKVFILTLFVFLSLNSLVGIMQFLFQQSLGIGMFWENQFTNTTIGMAKVLVNGEQWIRPVGFTPHANVFGFLSLIGSIYGIDQLITRANSTLKFHVSNVGLALLTFINTYGVILSLSRAVWVAGIIVLLCLTCIIPREKLYSMLLVIIALSIAVLTFGTIHSSYIMPRISVVSGTSVTERFNQYTYAIEGVVKHPIIGIGLGQNLLHMKQESKNLLPWEVQPIHNSYLLIINQMGLPIFLFIGYLMFKRLKVMRFRHLYTNDKNIVFIVCMLVGFAISAMFDHYPVTYFGTSILQFLTLGYFWRMILSPDNEEAKT